MKVVETPLFGDFRIHRFLFRLNNEHWITTSLRYRGNSLPDAYCAKWSKTRLRAAGSKWHLLKLTIDISRIHRLLRWHLPCNPPLSPAQKFRSPNRKPTRNRSVRIDRRTARYQPSIIRLHYRNPSITPHQHHLLLIGRHFYLFSRPCGFASTTRQLYLFYAFRIFFLFLSLVLPLC